MEKNIDLLYNCRKDFCVVALTGLVGSGCSNIAKMICEDDFISNANYRIRKPDDIVINIPEHLTNTDIYESHAVEHTYAAIKELIFKRKYTICYDYVTQHYKPFTLIKYNQVLWLCALLSIYKSMPNDAENDVSKFKNKVKELITKAYHPSYNSNRYPEDYDRISEKQYVCTDDEFDSLVDWNLLLKKIESLTFLHKKQYTTEQYRELYFSFFDEESPLRQLYLNFNHLFAEKDYFCFCFFYHRLGGAIRSTGNPIVPYDDFSKIKESMAKNENIFGVVSIINQLIKSIKKNGEKEEVRVCIDTLQNSLESKFLSERYAAYYLIAVNDDGRKETLKNKIQARVFKNQVLEEKQRAYLKLMQKNTEKLCLTEAESNQYEKGEFAGPNVAQCVADAEIHIVRPSNTAVTPKPMEFYTIGEQWMKFAALILHPGLITPSPEERCMEVAFTAKLNSGCISRQVGAVITNKNHTIRSIGWNDVPYGQIPCALREIEDLIDVTNKAQEHKDYLRLMYSDFELSSNPYIGYKESFSNCSFKESVCVKCQENISRQKTKLGALPYPYCFKTLHNQFTGDKNQVFTRSLHAEENAMMQMVKFGGEGLMDGIIYVTASPCELCSKKLYQLGVRKIVYIDPYPGIAREQIVANGFRRPKLQLFKGAYGVTYYKLYQPFIAYKDELAIRTK